MFLMLVGLLFRSKGQFSRFLGGLSWYYLKMDFTIRAATPEDCIDIFRMTRELSEYEKLSDQVKISLEDLKRNGFCQNPFYRCLIAEVPEEHKTKDGHVNVGYALFCYTYCTIKGKCVYLGDLYVMPEFRGKGIGKALMSSVAKVAKEQQCTNLQLSVLDWNTPSMDFYIAKGAQDLTKSEGWHSLRFHGAALDKLAEEAPKN
ncbi:thialysine N-epsilon-acetyltransferase-like [Clupea harengus]|uniref:Thialysine N-epsilon-acetyltransferase-like n=1 Tax=Clupea harengus TaxID=7950 RepID=A0A6P3W743_CLUHA|nr:thialysine N-epsilon-acetyltransferase-like [Clupea harengus]